MTSRNGDSLPLLLLPEQEEENKTNVHLESMSGNDVIRFRNLQQWYTTSICDVKRNFLRNILDVCEDPLFLFSLRKIFDKAYTRDVAPYNTSDWWSSDMCPAKDNESLLDLTASEQTTDDHSSWFDGLSKHVQLAVFVSPLLKLKTTIFLSESQCTYQNHIYTLELMLLGGIGVMTAIRVHLDQIIKLNGNLPSLRNLIGKNTKIQNSILAIDEDLLLIDRLSDSEQILSKTNLDKNKAKITDVVYRDYMERTIEWKNKLDSFEQKYHAIRRTTEPDSDLAQMLPVWHVIPAGEKLLSDPSCKETNATTTLTNGKTQDNQIIQIN